MSNDLDSIDWRVAVAARLVEERTTGLRLTCKGLAGRLVVAEKSQEKYEAGLALPPVIYFWRLANEGADVGYILNGERSGNKLSTEEQALVHRYRSASSDIQEAVQQVLGGTSPPEIAASAFFLNDVGQAVRGDVNGPVTIKMGGSAKKK